MALKSVLLCVLLVCLAVWCGDAKRTHPKHEEDLDGKERRGQHHHHHHHHHHSTNNLDPVPDEQKKIAKEEALGKPEECRLLKCRKRHLCLVNADTGVAECVHKRLLRSRKKTHSSSKHEQRKQEIKPSKEKMSVKENYYYRQKLRKMKGNSVVPHLKQLYYNPSYHNKDSYNYLDGKPQKKAELHARKMNSVVYSKGGKVCTKRDLDEMGRRLLDWFKLLEEEAEERQRDRHHKVKRHSKKKELWVEGECRCQAPVSWEFDQLDLNGDLQLDELELDDIKNNGYEHCVSPFIQACDLDHNTQLSHNEWCCCFKDVLPPCLAAQQRVPAPFVSGHPYLLRGAFVPTCDEDGFFKKQQCHPSTGYCWCVDRNGHELPRTKSPGAVDCEKIGSHEYSPDE